MGDHLDSKAHRHSELWGVFGPGYHETVQVSKDNITSTIPILLGIVCVCVHVYMWIAL